MALKATARIMDDPRPFEWPAAPEAVTPEMVEWGAKTWFCRCFKRPERAEQAWNDLTPAMRSFHLDNVRAMLEAALAAAPGDDIESLPLPEDRIVTTRSVRFEYVKNPPPLIWPGDFDAPAAAPGDALDAPDGEN